MLFVSHRITYLFGLIASCLLLASAYYAQYVHGLEPCPLCILQRLCLFVLVALFALAALRPPYRTWIKYAYVCSGVVIAALGVFGAGRQLWLETQPPQVTAICLPGSSYLLSLLPSGKGWSLLFQGTASCAQVTWTLFGLSIAVWTLACFVGLGLLWLWTLRRVNH